MSTKRKVTIGVIVAIVVVTGLGLLGWGEAVYRSSEGERGWSLGAAAYDVLGWDSEKYLSDFDRLHDWNNRDVDEITQFDLVDEDGDGVPDHARIDEELTATVRGSRFGRGRSRGHGRGFFGLVGGLFCTGLLALLIGLGVVLFVRRTKSAQS